MVATVIALAGFVTVGAPTAAAGSTGTLQYVALGDSYAAGIGAPPYRSVSLGDKICVQSISKGYPAFFDPKGRIDLQVNATCAGATTSDVAHIVKPGEPEESPLNSDTRLVTLTVGGNDLHFRDVLTTCSFDATACPSSVQRALDLFLPGLGSSLKNLYAEIAAAAPEARIVVTGYPILFDAERPSEFDPDLVIKPVNEATALLNETMEDAVAAANDADVNIHYVDVTEELAGHGVVRFINNPANPIDRSAFIHSPFICPPDPTDPAKCQDPAAYHPNDKGYSAYADAISAALPGGWLNKQLSA